MFGRPKQSKDFSLVISTSEIQGLIDDQKELREVQRLLGLLPTRVIQQKAGGFWPLGVVIDPSATLHEVVKHFANCHKETKKRHG